MAREISVRVTGDTKDLERALSRAQKKTSSFGDAMKKASKGALVGLAALGTGAFFAVRAASNLGEQLSKTNVVFGKSAKAVHAWSQTTAESFGISQRAALEAAGTFGNMLVPMGFARDEAAKMSRKFVELAADMASFNNASPEETLDALRAGLSGETEPLRRFGVFLNEARIKQQALNMGLIKGKEKLTASQKAAATYAIILKDTADTQGDFARTSESLANQERILRAQVEDTAAALGSALLPAARDVLGVTLDLVNAARDHGTETKVAAAALGTLGAAVVTANASLSIYNSSILKAVKATRLLKIAMATTPFLIAVTAVGLLAEHFLTQSDNADEATQSMRDLTRAVSNYNTAISAGQKAREQYEGASRRVEAAEIALNRAVKARTQVMKDDNATLDDRREATLNVAEAQANLRDATRDATAAGTKFREEQLKQTGAQVAARNALQGLAEQFRGNLTKATKVFSEKGKPAQTLIRRISEDSAEGRRNAEKYAAAIEAGAKKIEKSNPKLARTAEVAADLARAWGRVVSLPAAREFVARFRVITSIEENRLNTPSHRRRASGGPVTRGVSYVVGERGPELFTPSASGQIIPNGGGGGGGQFALIWAGPSFIDALRQANRDYGRRNGGRSIL